MQRRDLNQGTHIGKVTIAIGSSSQTPPSRDSLKSVCGVVLHVLIRGVFDGQLPKPEQQTKKAAKIFCRSYEALFIMLISYPGDLLPPSN